MQIFNIIQGWKSYLSKETSEIALERAKICSSCPSAILGTYEKWLPETSELKKIQGLKCNVCSCPLSAKLRSPNEICPLNKW